MLTNISISDHPEERVAKLLSLIGQPARIQILWMIGSREACVCHLEAALNMRQASISQHLMALRKAGLVSTHREGRNIFYRLAQPEVVEILQQAAQLTGSSGALNAFMLGPVQNCPCPQCNPGSDPNLSCQNIRSRAIKVPEDRRRS